MRVICDIEMMGTVIYTVSQKFHYFVLL